MNKNNRKRELNFVKNEIKQGNYFWALNYDELKLLIDLMHAYGIYNNNKCNS